LQVTLSFTQVPFLVPLADQPEAHLVALERTVMPSRASGNRGVDADLLRPSATEGY